MNKNNIINQVRETFKNYSNEQKMNIFNLMWNGVQVTKNPLINKLTPKMPGVQYKTLYANIEALKMFYVFKENDLKKLLEIEKQLTNFYKHDLWTSRTRHLTLEMRERYPVFLERLKKVFFKVRAKDYSDVDLFWIQTDLVNDVKACEDWEKARMKKEYGIL